MKRFKPGTFKFVLARTVKNKIIITKQRHSHQKQAMRLKRYLLMRTGRWNRVTPFLQEYGEELYGQTMFLNCLNLPCLINMRTSIIKRRNSSRCGCWDEFISGVKTLSISRENSILNIATSVARKLNASFTTADVENSFKSNNHNEIEIKNHELK